MKGFVCTGCSLLCDDVAIEYSKGELKSLGLCRLGHSHFEIALKQKEDNNSTSSIDEAIQKAVELLVSAQHPLCYGWTSSTNETIQEGLALSATLRGFFDTPTNLGISSTFGHTLHSNWLEINLEGVRNNAETVVFWGVNPAESSQRLISKFAVLPRGEKIPEGVETRTIAVIDVRRTETMKVANHQIIIEPNLDGALMDSILGELSKTAPIKNAIGKVSAAELIGFTKNLKKSDYTVFFYGSGLMNSSHYATNLEGLGKIIQILRDSGSKAYALPITIDCNAMGAMKVCQEITGFSTSVNFSSGQIEHNSRVTAFKKLVSGDFDAALIVGDDSILSTPGPVAKALARIPFVYIGPQQHFTAQKSTISLLSSESGIFSKGTMNRMDQKKIELMPIDDISLPVLTELDLITKLHENVRTIS